MLELAPILQASHHHGARVASRGRKMAGGGATIEELKDVLRETLENRGALGGVRAHLRAEVSHALEDRAEVPRPDISNENLVINELIREYLVFNRQGLVMCWECPGGGVTFVSDLFLRAPL